jgi:dethiobiotin synthetase
MRGDLFITGSDTGVGKTLLSAMLVAALNRKYWKPIQTGARDGTDRQTVIKWSGVARGRTYKETYLFDPPVSPHLAAEAKAIRIDLNRIQRPATPEPLIIEGAGGVFAPINDNQFMVDMMRKLKAPVVVAVRTAVGTINHTLLTVQAIRSVKLELRGVVMIGTENLDNRRAIERYAKAPVIGWIPRLKRIDRERLRSVFERHFNASAFV